MGEGKIREGRDQACLYTASKPDFLHLGITPPPRPKRCTVSYDILVVSERPEQGVPGIISVECYHVTTGKDKYSVLLFSLTVDDVISSLMP